MDLNDLFQSCKRGDLGRVQYLVEQKEIQLNVRDKWDSTPLYYACLCGHYDLAQYLLDNGARCEANTFDGERCLYGALNAEIRNLLRNYKVVTSHTLRRDCYEEHLRRLLENGEYSDVTFVVHGEQFRAHRCILSSRSEYFCDMFQTKWRHRRNITLTHKLVTSAAVRAIFQYLYTGRLETHVDQVEDCIRLAKQCKLPLLIEQLENTVKRAYSFECTKPGTNVTTILLEPPLESTDLQQDFGILAKQALPIQFCNWVGGSELPFLPDLERTYFTDLCFSIEGHHFLCHKAFFCTRSDYFKALLVDHFCEAEIDSERDMPVITLHEVRVDVFIQILYFIYQNLCPELSPNNIYEVLYAADLYLLSGLKRYCAGFLGQHIEISNVLELLQLSRIFELPRLEDQCTEFIARNLEEMIEDTEFHKLIIKDATEVQQRQETDSISIVDDIRYHITGNVQTFSAMEEANEKLQLIDELLETLGLDA